MAKRKVCFVVVCGVMVLASVLFAACGSSPTSGATCGNSYGVNGTGQIIVATGQSTVTADDGTIVHIYNPNTAYGPAPSCIQDWIPAGCTDQGTVFDETGENGVTGTLPWVPFFQASADMQEPQFNGLGVQTLRCGNTWRFLAWDDDSSHSYHEVSAPGRTDCPNGEVRETWATVLTKDPYGQSMTVYLEERGDDGSGWVASQVMWAGQVIGSILYPPHCPSNN